MKRVEFSFFFPLNSRLCPDKLCREDNKGRAGNDKENDCKENKVTGNLKQVTRKKRIETNKKYIYVIEKKV